MRLVVISSEQSDESHLLLTVVVDKVAFQTKNRKFLQISLNNKQYSHKKTAATLRSLLFSLSSVLITQPLACERTFSLASPQQQEPPRQPSWQPSSPLSRA